MPQTKDFVELEGLRGLLALSVAVGHSYTVLKYSGNESLWRCPPFSQLHSLDEYIVRGILIFAEGIGAVLVFFAVSGFVLAHALTKRSDRLFPPGASFSTRQRLRDQYYYLGLQRFFRLFPLHWAVLLLVISGFYFLQPAEGVFASEWYTLYQPRVPLQDRLLNFLFLSNEVNPPIWSLFHETWPLVSFPLLLLLFDRLRDFRLQLLALLALFIAGEASQIWLDINWIRNPFLFISLFGGGAVLYLHREMLRQKKMGPPLLYWLTLTSVRLIAEEYQNSYIWLWMSIFSLLLLASVVAAPPSSLSGRALRSRLLVWLGTRSYGFYIINFPLTYLVATEVLKNAPDSLLQEHAVMAGSLIASLSVSITALICGVAAYPFEAYWQRLRQKITRSG